MAVTGAAPVQDYGSTVLGTPPAHIAKMRHNIAVATGDQIPGTCNTTLLQWNFSKTKHQADPCIKVPLQQLMTWLRLWNANLGDKSRITERWHNLHMELHRATNRWQLVRGPMGATISTLLDLGIKPAHPINWITSNYALNISHDKHSRHRVEHEVTELILKQIWNKASDQYNGKGLKAAPPDMEPAMSVHKALLRKGEFGQARSLKAAALNKTWCGHRIAESLKDNLQITEEERRMAVNCIRCGGNEVETSLHKYYL